MFYIPTSKQPRLHLRGLLVFPYPNGAVHFSGTLVTKTLHEASRLRQTTRLGAKPSGLIQFERVTILSIEGPIESEEMLF